MNEINNNKVNLCDSCSQVYPDCTSKPEDVYFGDGIGHDNICACSEYQPKSSESKRDSSDTISRQAAIDALGEKPLVWDDLSDFDLGKAAQWSDDVDAIKELPSSQPELIEKTAYIRGFEQGRTQGRIDANLQPTCNQLATDCISRQAAIDAIEITPFDDYGDYMRAEELIEQLPSAQPEIIRCNVCRHWHQTTGEMKGFGLGDCDYLEKKLVTCNGYCYWAERKGDE